MLNSTKVSPPLPHNFCHHRNFDPWIILRPRYPICNMSWASRRELCELPRWRLVDAWSFSRLLSVNPFLFNSNYCFLSYAHKCATNTRLQIAQTNRFSENNHAPSPCTSVRLLKESLIVRGFEEHSVSSSAPPTSGISGLIFQVHVEAFLYQLYQYWCRIGQQQGGWQPIPQLNLDNNFTGRLSHAGRGQSISDPRQS